jgi:hypothetical protein
MKNQVALPRAALGLLAVPATIGELIGELVLRPAADFPAN